MANDLISGRRKVPDFEHWESPETRVRWERGLAIVAGMFGVICTFFLLLALLPLSADDQQRPVTGQAPAEVQAQPPAAAAAGLQATAAATQAAAATPAELKLTATSRASPNVRRGPSLDAAIVTQLRPEQKVDVVGRSGDGLWLQIAGPDNPRDRFWVSADMLDVSGDARTLPEARP